MTDMELPPGSGEHEQPVVQAIEAYHPKPKDTGIPRSEDLSMVMTQMLLRPRSKSAGCFRRFKRRRPQADD
jgi:hypothetical protein